MIEIYEHYATNKTRELEIMEIKENRKIGYDKKVDKLVIVLKYKSGWKIKGSSFILKK